VPRATGLAVAAAVLVAGAAAWWAWATSYFVTDPAPVFALALAMLVIVGLVAARMLADATQSGNGALLLLYTGLGLVGQARYGPGPLAALGWALPTLSGTVLAAFALRYPGRRFRDDGVRRFLVASALLTVLTTVLTTVLWDPSAFSGDERTWWPTLASDRSSWERAQLLALTVSSALAVWFAVLVVRTRRRLVGVARSLHGPVHVGALVGAGLLVLGNTAGSVRAVAPSTAPVADSVSAAASLLQLPTVLLVLAGSAVVARSQREHMVEALMEGGTPSSPRLLQQRLREVIGDERLTLLFRSPDGWLDVDGTATSEPPGDRIVLPLTAGTGAASSSVIVDADLGLPVGALWSVARVCGLALDNARLEALAARRTDELRSSRERLARVSDDERRRMERDLHDGAQQSLLAVATTLSRAQAVTQDPEVQQRLALAAEQLQGALAELRELAHGMHPAVLTQAGLRPAVESVLDRLHLPAELDVPDRRWPAPVESTAYFVVAEALVNVVKHAEARSVSVRAREEGGRLRVVVSDDGRGADGPLEGVGLTNLRDRVEAAGGTFRWSSDPGHGTTVEAELPCA
jgi:signal transduction histidine kinase